MSIDVVVENGRYQTLDEGYGSVASDLDGEDRRLVQAHLQAASRAIRAHADHDTASFSVKASPFELHVKKL